MSKENKSITTKCPQCLSYDKEKDCCKIHKDKKECSKTNFSKKCIDFCWDDKYTMF